MWPVKFSVFLSFLLTSCCADPSRFTFSETWSPQSLDLTEWNFSSGSKGSFNSVSTADDPFNSNGQCYSIFFAKQSFGINTDNKSGVQVNCKPLKDQSANRAMVSYELAFPENFDWVRGGKLPGISGGWADVGCTGGREANGRNCFSVRLMWRENGAAEVYTYLPKSLNRELCTRKDATCNADYGTSVGRNFQFKTGQWMKVDLFVQLNSQDESNGYMKLYIDNQLQVDLSGLVYRTTNDLFADIFGFSSFFGGSTPAYATPVDTNVYIKNIRFQTDQGYLNSSIIALDSSSIAYTPTSIVYFLVSISTLLSICVRH